MTILSENISQIKALCKLNNVKKLFAFGSVIKNDLKPESDIDLLVDIIDKDPLTYSDHYFNLKFKLEDLLKRKIDLLEDKAINNIFLKDEIEKTKVLIYEE